MAKSTTTRHAGWPRVSPSRGDNYTKTYAPVVVFKNLRFILMLACLRNLEIHTMDVVLAFLHTELTEEIYVEQLLLARCTLSAKMDF